MSKIKITASLAGDSAVINITDEIGGETANSKGIRSQIDQLLINKVTNADVYINSQGGSVFEGMEIANQLRRIPNVKIRGGTMIASAATYLTSLFHTTAQSNTRFMIHKPSVSTRGNETSISTDLSVLKGITNEYRTVYAKKTGKTEQEIENLWSKGDVWLTAQEALKWGFIDAISDGSPTASAAFRSDWTIDDYLDKDPDALLAMETANPALFAQLNAAYFGSSVKSSKEPQPGVLHGRSGWTLDDYLDKDPDALLAMETANPALFAQLNAAYFG